MKKIIKFIFNSNYLKAKFMVSIDMNLNHTDRIYYIINNNKNKHKFAYIKNKIYHYLIKFYFNQNIIVKTSIQHLNIMTPLIEVKYYYKDSINNMIYITKSSYYL